MTTLTDKPQIGAESFEVERSEPMANIGPGHVEYGTGQRVANNRSAGGNLPFRQQIHDDPADDPTGPDDSTDDQSR